MMKRLLTLGFIITISLSAFAQAKVDDVVKIGSGYPNQIWYSLEYDEQGTLALADWDIAFNLRDIESSIRINSANNVKLWGYPKADISGWSTVDTNGLSTWGERYNSDSTWSFGAMGNYIDPNNQWDIDWGIYDLTTHNIFGDSLYIIKLGNGDYKKMQITSLIKGVFTFKFADLNGANEKVITLNKTDYANKNFAYYSLQNNAALNPEPNNDNWELLFTKYLTFIGGTYPYLVTGVLHNKDVTVAECRKITDVPNFINWFGQNFESPINQIGYDWKEYDMGSGTYQVNDSLVYFVKTIDEAIWKLVFTDFVPTGGEYYFTKQKLAAAGINDTKGKTTATIALVPNPAVTQNVNLVYNLNTTQQNVTVAVYDLTGKIVHTAQLEKQPGLHQYIIPAQYFASGTYIVTINTDNGKATQKLVVQ